MKKMLLTGTALGALLVSAAAAQAADVLPIIQPAPQVVAPMPVAQPFSWSGFYVGVTGGLAAQQFTFPYNYSFDFGGPVFEGDGVIETSAGGFTAGVGAGFAIQRNNLVFGIEGDWNWTNFQSRIGVEGDVPPPFAPPGTTIDAEAYARVNWFATLRARVGFAMGNEGRFQPYFTGGLAYGRTTLGANILVTDGVNPPLIDFEGELDPITRLGWTVGAGAEFAISDNLSFKTEYLLVNLGTENIFTFAPAPDNELNINVTTRFHTLRAGLNFRF